MRRISYPTYCLLALIGLWQPGLRGQTIFTTRHNLSVSGPGRIKAVSESDVCVFCHPAGHAKAPQSPMWNRKKSGAVYTLYSSSTLNAVPGQPDGSSILCLSCHDGTVALGTVLSGPDIAMTGATILPRGRQNLSTDLSNDHPISFVYSSGLASSDGQLKTPAAITPPVHLEKGKVQCTSCHDPHIEMNPDFLVTTAQQSALCLSCHQRTYWSSSSHSTSSQTWNGTAPNPWFHTSYNTVADNACENCHNPHNAGGSVRLMKYRQEENNCLDCHNGNAAESNIQADLMKTYRHDVFSYTGLHEPRENPLTAVKHVECSDCHNPHASNSSANTAPYARGTETGVSGIDQSGNFVGSVTYAYEVCYKCHSGNSWIPVPATPRQISQANVRLEFASDNPSFHPVTAPRNNIEVVPNLVTPNNAGTVLYCSDCHSGTVPGPHGSSYPQILKLQYLKGDGPNSQNGTTESAASYALCYSCHNRTNLLGGVNSFREHQRHVVAERTPCNTCHDPHGISSTQGNATNNSNLINFNTAVVKPSSGGTLLFEDQGSRRGSCFLTCHGKDHNPLSY